MAHFNITFQDLEHIFKPMLNGRYIIRVKEHPFLARTLMAEFPGDEDESPEEPMLLEPINDVTESVRQAHGIMKMVQGCLLGGPDEEQKRLALKWIGEAQEILSDIFKEEVLNDT